MLQKVYTAMRYYVYIIVHSCSPKPIAHYGFGLLEGRTIYAFQSLLDNPITSGYDESTRQDSFEHSEPNMKLKRFTSAIVAASICFAPMARIQRANSNPAIIAPIAFCAGTAGVGCVLVGTAIIGGSNLLRVAKLQRQLLCSKPRWRNS